MLSIVLRELDLKLMAHLEAAQVCGGHDHRLDGNSGEVVGGWDGPVQRDVVRHRSSTNQSRSHIRPAVEQEVRMVLAPLHEYLLVRPEERTGRLLKRRLWCVNHCMENVHDYSFCWLQSSA